VLQHYALCTLANAVVPGVRDASPAALYTSPPPPEKIFHTRVNSPKRGFALFGNLKPPSRLTNLPNITN
jgi:hypothetical protein